MRRLGRAFRRGLAHRWRSLLGIAGVAAAVAGAWLGSSPAPVGAGLDAGGYHIGSSTLPSRGEGVYAGGEGAVVIRPEGDRTRAAASTRIDGIPMTGVCETDPGGRGERCGFELGGRSLGATDRLREGGWDRRYDDGVTVRVPLTGRRPAPVPFALGR